jgi:hypothetical protein
MHDNEHKHVDVGVCPKMQRFNFAGVRCSVQSASSEWDYRLCKHGLYGVWGVYSIDTAFA